MRNKNKKVYFVLILIVLFAISIGYAVMNRTLSITGDSEVKQNTWNVYFDNVKVKEGSVETDSLPVIDSTTKSTVNFNVMLNLPGDFYEFTVDVVNSGTIDAMIDSIVKIPELTDTQKKYLNYVIEYQNGEQIASKQLVKNGEFVRIKVRVEYRNDLSEFDMPTTSETLNLGFNINYVQADSTGVSVKDNGELKVVYSEGDINEIGTVVNIGTEKFYVIGTEGDNVKLFAKYNLYVGGTYDPVNKIWTPYGEEATGMQDETMIGWIDRETLRQGITLYTEISGYLSYESSLVKTYIDNYKTLLESNFDVKVDSARAISKEELFNQFGCALWTCSGSNYPWIYSTSYWTGTSHSSNNAWCTWSDNYFAYSNGFLDYEMGVRPVILISKEYFE